MSWTLLGGSSSTFNWTWVIELIISVLLVNWFLFYFNRLFATLVSYGIRAYTWHKFRIWIDIQALQISFLAGRLFFKGVRYHGENETILIQNGYLTWRYWLKSTRQVDLTRYRESHNDESKKSRNGAKSISGLSDNDDNDEETGLLKKANTLEARIAVAVTGLEWFVYNRTPAYDTIFPESAALHIHHDEPSWDAKKFEDITSEVNSNIKYQVHGEKSSFPASSSSGESSEAKRIPLEQNSRPSTAEDPSSLAQEETHSLNSDAQTGATVTTLHSLMLAFLPLGIECSRGAIILGNENTRALIVTTFNKAKGHIDASCAGENDIYRQMFDFEIEHPVVQMRPNPDFRRSQHAAAERILQALDTIENKKRWWHLSLGIARRRRKAARRLRTMLPGLQGSVESFRAPSYVEKNSTRYTEFDVHDTDGSVWHGLDRYLDDADRDDHEGWSHIDYARFSTILDSPAVHLNFYWDVPGRVTEEDVIVSRQSPVHDINGASPPAYGMDLTIKGGDVNYGPWADRLRLEIQSVFFPNPYKSVSATQVLKAGDWRQYTVMSIRVDIEDEVTLRVPTRERSKDWQWRGRAQAVREAAIQRKHRGKRHFRFRKSTKTSLGPNIRPFGWISVAVAADSTVRYCMDMLPRSNGYHNELKLELKDTRVTSSVNHALLWRCPLHKIDCDLSNPAGWNSPHNWKFDVQSDGLEMFLLRDHMFLLTDLISDFTAGQRSEYMTFVPYYYGMGLVFNNLKLRLNANDFNIIDNPCDPEENAYLVLGFQDLIGNVDIPMQYFSPRQSKVIFHAEGHNATLDLITPTWNTFYSFLEDNSMATLKSLGLDGTYNYYSGIAPDLTDSLLMTISGTSPKFYLHGFLIRYFMNVKENYFGDHLHFKTLEEYQGMIADGNEQTTARLRPSTKKENDLDVILTVRADQSSVLMPANIYSRDKNIRADVLLVEADMRFTNYYMDLQVSTSPLEASTETITQVGKPPNITSCQLYIDGITASGHRLFGAPPTEPTYVCNWDFDIGSISGECSTSFVQTFIQSIKSFIFTLDDFENALPEIITIPLHDVTFLRARIAGAHIWLLGEDAAFLLDISPSEVGFNDFAGQRFAKHVHANVPQISLAVVDLKSATRHHENADGYVKTFAYFNTSLKLATLDKTASLGQTRALQQQHLKYHDQRTRRTDWLLHRRTIIHSAHQGSDWSRDPPAMPVPAMPQPLLVVEEKTTTSARLSSAELRPKSSFISTNSPSRDKDLSLVVQDRDFQSFRSISETLQPPRDTSRASRILSSLTRERSQQAESDMDSVDKRRSSQAALSRFSSPWIKPHFALENVRPDTRNLPHVKFSPHKPLRHRSPVSAYDPAERDDDTESMAHMGILCLFENGCVGFCTPALFPAIAGLIRDLQPNSSLHRLDELQQDVMARVMKRINPKKASATVDLAIRLPFAHIRLNNVDDEPSVTTKSYKDQYDMRVAKLHADCRFLTRRVGEGESETQPLAQAFFIYASFTELSLSATDSVWTDKGPASALASISNVGIQVSSQDKLKGSFQLESLLFELGAAKVERTANLLQRSAVMTEFMTAKFADLVDGLKTRHLVYHLTQTASTAADPVFLTRPSYVLRSASTHARMSDSWKILSRLRFIYFSATTQQPKQNFETCACQDVELTDNARNHLLTSFENWRGWDHAVDRTPIVEAMFGVDPQSFEANSSSTSIQFQVIVGQIALILDPGSGQNDLTLMGIDTNVQLAAPGQSSESSMSRRKLALQSYVADIGLSLNWEMVELVSSLLQRINLTVDSSNIAHKTASRSPRVEEPKLDVELVFGADLVSISLTSMNLRLKLGAESLRASAIHSPADKSSETSSFTIASHTAMAKLGCPSGGLLVWKLSDPKIYGSFTPPRSGKQRPSLLRIAAACERLRFNLKKDIPELINVAREVINSEVKETYQLLSSVSARHTEKHAPKPANDASTPIELHLAMFLDDYKLNLAVLPTLRYGIVGKVARTSIIPRGHGSFEVNFDLKQHEHVFRSNLWQDTYQHPSVLKMPPVNGRVTVRSGENSTMIKAHVTVEKVLFEAAAVRACFDVVNQPGFLNAMESIQSDAKKAEESLREIFGSNIDDGEGEDEGEDKPKSLVRFAIDGIIAGLSIHCRAPSSRSPDSHTDLNFELGATSLLLYNGIQGTSAVHEKPQFHVNVQEIALGLYRNEKNKKTNFGRFAMGIKAFGITEMDDHANQLQVYRASSDGIKVDMFEETASLVLDIATFLQDRIKSITISEHAKNIRPLRRLTLAGLGERPTVEDDVETSSEEAKSSALFDSIYSLEIGRIQIRWGLHDGTLLSPGRELEDLIFSIRKIELQTRREGSARLSILDLQLQIVPHSQDPVERTSNSALLPEVIFSAAYHSTKNDRRFAFQAKGKALDLRLAADFVVPASALQKSLANASAEMRKAKARLGTTTTAPDPKKASISILGGKRLASLLVDADFAGAVVHISPRRDEEARSSVFGILKGAKRSRAGRYGQVVQGENATEATLQAPGVAFKVGYHDNGKDDPALSTEIKVAASSNTLFPSVVPLILEISSSIKEILGEDNPVSERQESTAQTTSKYLSDAAMTNGDPTAILGKCKLNAGLWIQRQEFGLSCQPIARVSATARFDDIFVTINTVQSSQQERFFSVLTTFNNLQASVQHVYSRESTASFEVESIVMSLMNSKHISASTGISAILNVSPMKTDINAKQLQDFLLFREIWYPEELRGPEKTPAPVPTTSDTQAYAIQRYQQIAATGTLPWNAVISIQELKLQVDFGQGLGKSLFTISKLWASSKKSSDSEQNLCIGFDKVGADSTGRMSGFVELQNFRVRTSIRWPADAAASTRAPLVQGSVGLNNLRMKAAFDYQPFAVADISTFEFLIYNVRERQEGQQDRLVGILNGGKIQAFCTTATASQALALVQAFERLIQEKQEAYENALHELDKYLRRKSVFPSSTWNAPLEEDADEKKLASKGGFSLHTDVVVTLKAVDIGAFPNTFFDTQMLKVEATDAQARFAVSTTDGRTHSGLGMTLGQVRVALSNVNRADTKALGEVSVPDVIERATTSKGGTILRVPRLVASMSTWQSDQSNVIEYIFRSTFEGKVDVGWNYSRISFIRGMWQTHSRALAQRLGKPLPPSALKITAEPQGDGASGGQEKITAVVNMPQSRFKYVALQPPIIDTPQLRDLGEATPSLEWIGLHRDRLPEATHSVAIVTLLEIAKEVEDAYTRILGSS